MGADEKSVDTAQTVADAADGDPADLAEPSAEDDARLVALVLAGDDSAFETIFRRHRDALFRNAWRFARDEDTALDLVQEAFVRAYESLASFRAEGSLLTWLRRIMTNLAIDRTRRKSYKVVSFDEQAQPATQSVAISNEPQRAAELHEFTDALWEAVGQLSEAHREVFLLHAVEELSYKEIAARAGCNLGTVMSRLHYARRNLQEMLRSYWDESDA